MNGVIISQKHLEYRGGNSYKEYNVIVTQDGSLYNLYARYGRIGGSLIQVIKVEGGTFGNVHAAAVKLIDQKEKKGYGMIKESVTSKFNSQYVASLTQRAATLTAEGGLERNHYASIKAMLKSPDDETLLMAEKIIVENESKLQKPAA